MSGARLRRLQFTKLTTDEITKAMEHYSYGEGTERKLSLLVSTLAHGLLQINAGFRVGGTLSHILRDMGLIAMRSGNITVKGRMFLYDCFNGSTAIYWAMP